MQCAAGLFDVAVGGFLGRVGHHAGGVVLGGAVGVMRVEIEMDAGVAVVVLLAPAGPHPVADLGGGQVAGWLREADLVAGDRRWRRIEGRDVLAARRRASERLGVDERRAFEAMLDGRVRITTAVAAVGQVNGLAVHDYGNLGKVARITATVGPGSEGLVNVEREVALSGASYDKGVHILAGYPTEAVACTRETAPAIRIVFEQSYGHLTGDSATGAEAEAPTPSRPAAP